jgi:predicted cobalt transporter CbtA
MFAVVEYYYVYRVQILYKDSESSAAKDAATAVPAATTAAATTDGQAAPADGSKEEGLHMNIF